MRKFILEFFRRGLVACGFGPLVLAIIYLILQRTIDLETLTVNQVCIGIFSITALAFIAGGMNAIYKIENIPLMFGILIHGGVLYISYFITYFVNDWLKFGIIPIVIFSVVFVIGYIMIWGMIYLLIKRKISKINEVLREKQQETNNIN